MLPKMNNSISFLHVKNDLIQNTDLFTMHALLFCMEIVYTQTILTVDSFKSDSICSTGTLADVILIFNIPMVVVTITKLHGTNG